MTLLTVAVLFHGDRLLLLKRASWKKFAPNRWTGIGGKVEPHELGDVTAAAWRELFEETDLEAEEIADFRLRRAVLMDKPDEGLVGLLFFTGHLSSDRVPPCNEGTLRWVTPAELADLDVVDNASEVLRLLVDDFHSGASNQVICGTATYDRDGRLEQVRFADQPT